MKRTLKLAFLAVSCCLFYTANTFAETQVSPQPPKTQVVIIGTIHSAHYKNPNYSPDVLKQIILSLKPDAILNELPLSLVDPNGRPKHRDYSSYPENWASYTAAMELGGIPQIPFDRPDRQENFRKTKYFERQKRANRLSNKWGEELMKEDPNSVDLKIAQLLNHVGKAEHHLFMNCAPEIINSEAHDSIARTKHSVWHDILPGILTKYPGYETLIDDYHFYRDQHRQRNRIMADNIIKAAEQYPDKRLVVITGATHRYVLRDLLKNEKSVNLREFWEIIEAVNYNATESDQSDIKPKQETIKEIVASVAGSEGPARDRAAKLVKWMNENFEWTSTDYKQWTVEEIIQRRGGNCAEQAKVLMGLFKTAGIQARWVEEINIHPKNKRRQANAEKLIAKHGNKLSVFGYMHNDHRWLEVYDDAANMWIPADPTLGVFGVKEWVRVRLGFGKRPKAAKDMIVPFVVIIRQNGRLIEDRSEHYLVTEFNTYYVNKLSKLSAWPRWVSSVCELSKLGSDAFGGKVNLHEHTDRMVQLEQAYIDLKKEYLTTGSEVSLKQKEK